ncbi:MAG: hypothetical protein IT256_02110 [Chitinophagaceae bacterium]|nr:hypothetical protein [Chitinophagaceae bacterium]
MSNYNERNTDTPPKWRAWLHIAMGVAYLFFAALIYSAKSFGSIELSQMAVYGLSGLLCFYGLFRIWRGAMDLKQIGGQE